MKPNRDNYPSGKQIIKELACSSVHGLSGNELIVKRWESLRENDAISSDARRRGKPAVLRWLYELVRENYSPDAREVKTHDETIRIIFDEVYHRPILKIEILQKRKLERAGRRGGLGNRPLF